MQQSVVTLASDIGLHSPGANMLVTLLFMLAVSFYLYVEAMKAGLNAFTWAAAGFLLGPMVIPIYFMQRHIEWRKIVGFERYVLSA